MLGDHRGNIGGDIFDDASPRRPAQLNRAVAVGAGFQGVFLVAIDLSRCDPSLTGMSYRRPFRFSSTFGGRFSIGWRLSRRC